MYETLSKWCKTLLTILTCTAFLIFTSYAGVTQEGIRDVATEIAESYEVDPILVHAIIEHESMWDPEVKNGNHYGLMQVSYYWHRDRAKKLGITDWYDVESNITLGVDYLAELFETYEDYELVVMLYATNHDEAFWYYREGLIEPTAKEIIDLVEELRSEV